MNYQAFLQSEEWQVVKSMLKEEFELKPMKIKDDLSTERIALEVRAMQLASKNIDKFIRKMEGKFRKETTPTPYI